MRIISHSAALAIFVGVFFAPADSDAALLDFELGTTAGENFETFLSDPPYSGLYGGLDWDDQWTIYNTSKYHSFGGSGSTTATPPSGDEWLYNWAGGTLSTATSSTPFDAVSAWFGTWLTDDDFGPLSSEEIRVEGYANGSLVGDVTVQLGTSYQLIGLNFSSIDELRVVNLSPPGTYWFMDDLTIEAAAPAPAVWMLLLIGLGLLYRRDRATALIETPVDCPLDTVRRYVI